MAAPGQQREDTIGLWLNKATDPGNPEEDWESIQRLCDLINADPEGPLIATRLLAHKIQSPQAAEALRSLTVLETCINNCGTSFHGEIGKYRFLNELIKVLSPKFLGAWSADSVKERITEIFYSWTIWFPDESKIQNAYKMLKKNGIIKKDPKLPGDKLLPPPSPRPRDSIFDDEEKSQLLGRLLKSSRPEDLQAANRLIKSIIKEEQEKSEKISRRVSTINDVQTQTELLTEMLSKYQWGMLSPGDRQAMQGLYERCERLRPTLFRLASDTVDNDEALAEVLRANDNLALELAQYRRIVGGDSDGRSPVAEPVEMAEMKEPVSESSNRSYRLMDFTTLEAAEQAVHPRIAPQLFSTPSVCLLEEEFLSLALQDSPAFEMALPDPVEPVVQNGLPCAQAFSQTQTMEAGRALVPNGGLSENLMSGGLISPPQNPSLPHVRLRDLSAEKAMPLDLPAHYVEMEPLMKINSSGRSSQDQQSGPAQPSSTTLNASLANLFVPLESIRPSRITPVTVYDNNGLKVMMHVSSETAPERPEVTVLVLSMLSTAPEPIHHIVFQASVPKAMRVKLQPASGSELPSFNPLLPPEVISQVLLLLKPHKDCVRLRYKLTFNQAGKDFIEVGEIHGSQDDTVWMKI
ncbi:ADP-ribosylation factor-binding protein GGA2 [Ambystoma mexicanum]|uniref:ADP-ribosylation factor-binding protein GGA2 n=1 Tax=Ambystoma mexicanum TaxID=8296 RepID=UPI0037E80D13